MPKYPLERASDLTKEFLKDPEYAALYRESANEEIGAMLRSIRKTRGLSQREVADKMGVSRSRISQIEGTEGMSLALSVLNRYLLALGCRFDVAVRDLATGDSVGKVFMPTLHEDVTKIKNDTPYEPVSKSNGVSDNILAYKKWSRAA